MKKIHLLYMLACMACVSSARAIPLALSFGDGYSIGLIDDGIPSGTVETAGYVNTLVSRPLGSGPTLVGTEYYTRTNNNFGTLPSASGAPGNFLKQDNNSTIFDLGAGGFAYILGKYDAHNAGSYVWNVTGLTGQVSMPQFFSNGQYEISHSIAFKGSGDTPGVPDGGSTIALLAIATGLLVYTRRFSFV